MENFFTIYVAVLAANSLNKIENSIWYKLKHQNTKEEGDEEGGRKDGGQRVVTDFGDSMSCRFLYGYKNQRNVPAHSEERGSRNRTQSYQQISPPEGLKRSNH